MTWVMDPELYELFAEELNERSAVLADGARAIEAGVVDEIDPEEMRREGHTIKGTGRMMGFTAISSAGKLLEDTWRSIDEGGLEIDARLAAVEDAIDAVIGEVATDINGVPIPPQRFLKSAPSGERDRVRSLVLGLVNAVIRAWPTRRTKLSTA